MSKILRTAALTCMLASSLLGCSKPSTDASPDPAGSKGTVAASLASHDDHHDHDEPCDDERSGSKLVYPAPTTSKDGEGKTVVHFGPGFSVEGRTTVADIQRDHAKLAGRDVYMEGFVTASCKRKRGWFAIVDDRRSGKPLRVLTTPSFRVPVDAVGKRVRVEGKVGRIEVPAPTARHMAKEHALPVPDQETGMVEQVVVKAMSAEFY